MKKFMVTIIMVVVVLITVITSFETKAVDKDVNYFYTEYEIQKGDTLSEICYNIYNSSDDNQIAWESYKDLMNEVIKINQINKFDRIHAGNYLTLVYAEVK